MDATRSVALREERLKQLEKEKETISSRRTALLSQLVEKEAELVRAKVTAHNAPLVNFCRTRTTPPLYYTFNKQDDFTAAILAKRNAEIKEKEGQTHEAQLLKEKTALTNQKSAPEDEKEGLEQGEVVEKPKESEGQEAKDDMTVERPTMEKTIEESAANDE